MQDNAAHLKATTRLQIEAEGLFSAPKWGQPRDGGEQEHIGSLPAQQVAAEEEILKG